MALSEKFQRRDHENLLNVLCWTSSRRASSGTVSPYEKLDPRAQQETPLE